MFDHVAGDVEWLGDVRFLDSSSFQLFKTMSERFIGKTLMGSASVSEEGVCAFDILVVVCKRNFIEHQRKQTAQLVRNDMMIILKDILGQDANSFLEILFVATETFFVSYLWNYWKCFKLTWIVPQQSDVSLKVVASGCTHCVKNITVDHLDPFTWFIEQIIAFSDYIE